MSVLPDLARTIVYRTSIWTIVFFSTHSLTPTNLTSDRYVYPTCPTLSGPPIILYPNSQVQWEALYCPSRGLSPQRCQSRALRVKVNFFLGLWNRNCFTRSPQLNYFDSAYTGVSPLLRYFGSNSSFFFVKVHAITRSFAASFTRIFVPIPFSLYLSLSLLVQYTIKLQVIRGIHFYCQGRK